MFISDFALFLFLTVFRYPYTPQRLHDPSIGIEVTVIMLILTTFSALDD
jgi:hypothetical protein